MDRSIVRKLVRRTALILTSVLQLTHSCLQIEYKWTPPKKQNQKLVTICAIFVPGVIIGCVFKIAEHTGNIKLGKRVVRGLRIELLLWAIVLWSAALVGVDIWANPDNFMTTVQMLMFDIFMFMDMSGKVGLLDKECGDQPAADEKMETEKTEV